MFLGLGGMVKFGRLTIGIISRNGQPFLRDCLQSFSLALTTLLKHFDSINFILVDSDSSDNTLEVMHDFSRRSRSDTIDVDIYLIEGYCNAAVARNIILRECIGDIVFLCDGDIVIDYNFLILAAEKIIGGQADAVVGQLSEKWYDSEFKIYKSIPVRNKITQEQFVRMAGGIILLSKKVVQSDVKYDENLKIKEDGDFSLRVSNFFNILAIPAFVGTHITQPYYSSERFKIFFKENYNNSLGILLRKHIYSLRNLVEISRAEKGVLVGFIYMPLFLLSSILCLREIYVPFILTVCIFFADFLRHLTKSHLRSFIMYRLISPIMVTHGFFSTKKGDQNYSIKKIDTSAIITDDCRSSFIKQSLAGN